MSSTPPDPWSPSGDEIVDISSEATAVLKVERTLMGFMYLLMLVLACANVWNYLIKRRMYKSYPMVVAYIILVSFSLFGSIYELFMGLHCGTHDCITYVLLNKDISKTDRQDFRKIHKPNITAIGVSWKIRQQLLWSMGVCQAVTLVVLILRIR